MKVSEVYVYAGNCKRDIFLPYVTPDANDGYVKSASEGNPQ